MKATSVQLYALGPTVEPVLLPPEASPRVSPEGTICRHRANGYSPYGRYFRLGTDGWQPGQQSDHLALPAHP